MLSGVMVQLKEVMMTYRKSLISPSKATRFIESYLFVYISMAWCNKVVTQFFKILQERQKTDFLKTGRRINCPLQVIVL